jgi:thiol-disulfide isomerase/thioredoxin
VQRARPRHDAAGLGERRRARAAAGPSPSRFRSGGCLLLLGFLLVGCGGGNGDTAGGAADLPGPVPEGVAFTDPPAGAPRAPGFSAELLDGTPISAADLWAERPLVLVFTASWCGRCAELHRVAAAAVDEHGDAIALLGMVAEDDAGDALDYAEELDLGYPIAVAPERVWLNYAAREPPVVVLISRGGKVLRGWPGGVAREVLNRRLGDLIASHASR